MKLLNTHKKKLAEIANDLPQLQRSEPNGKPAYKWKRELGRNMLERDPKMLDAAGQPIAANRYYWMEVPSMVNHYEHLKAALVRGGWEAVTKYCEDARAILEQATRIRPWWQRTFYAWMLRFGIYTRGMEAQQAIQQLLKGNNKG